MDVSDFLELGNNVIHVQQRHNMSEFIFVLHAHFPTPAQLKELERRRQLNRDWNAWLREVVRPPKRSRLPWQKLNNCILR